jgi:hypothetical protein
MPALVEAGASSVPPIAAPVASASPPSLFPDADLPLCSKPSRVAPRPPPAHTAHLIEFPPPFPVPVSVLHRLEERRKQLGITQAAMAQILGIRQPHYANCLRGHDKAAEWVLRRAVEFIADTQRLAA